jgi:hypothetical protein
MLVIASLATMALTGCSNLPNAPSVATDSPNATGATASPKVAAAMTVWTWNQVASQWVNKGEAATVSGSRYKIQFVRGSLAVGTTVVIMERDPSVSDGIVGPSGTVLAKPATLTISYAGSAVAAAPDFLKLYRLNDVTGLWEVVAGTNDLAAKTFTAKVSALGRFAVSAGDPTKAGW